MAIQTITINQAFDGSVKQVFSTLSDHEKFGKICGINMKRIVDGAAHLNGLGSVREIKVGVLPAFQETITKFIENEKIEYKITKGSPIKNHLGVLIFTETKGKAHLKYTIELESKIPLTTSLIKFALESGIKKGLKSYAKSLK
jgi:hypothetical protein|tara:strand:+ start:3945 stop:4373 length:429 start_codon:yes stop_codon:yes gene_type:complete